MGWYFLVSFISFIAGFIADAALGDKARAELQAEKGKLLAELLILKKKL